MNRIQIVFLLTIGINSIAFGKSQTVESENHTEDSTEWKFISEDNYKIEYPSNWDVDNSGIMGTSFMLFSPVSNELDKFKENVNLLIQDLTGYDMNLDQYVEISEGQIATLITEGEIISSERKKQGEKEYHKVIYTGKQGIFDLKFEQYYWVMDNQAFILTLTCEEDEFYNYQETGEKILNSFEIK